MEIETIYLEVKVPPLTGCTRCIGVSHPERAQLYEFRIIGMRGTQISAKENPNLQWTWGWSPICSQYGDDRPSAAWAIRKYCMLFWDLVYTGQLKPTWSLSSVSPRIECSDVGWLRGKQSRSSHRSFGRWDPNDSETWYITLHIPASMLQASLAV